MPVQRMLVEGVVNSSPPPGKIIGITSKIVKPEILMKGPLYVVYVIG